jgi:hypothetical protein
VEIDPAGELRAIGSTTGNLWTSSECRRKLPTSAERSAADLCAAVQLRERSWTRLIVEFLIGTTIARKTRPIDFAG